MYANHEAPHPARVVPYPAHAPQAHPMHASEEDSFPIIMYQPPGGEAPAPPPPSLPPPKHTTCRILQYDAARMAQRLERKRTGAYDFQRLTSAILLNQLKNGARIGALYAANGGRPSVDCTYEPGDAAQQAAARATLRAHALDEDREQARADKRWTIMWKQASTKDRPRGLMRLLLQCPCGYEHASKYHPSVFAYTGCLAHAEITIEEPSQKVLRIRGHLEHNPACVETKTRVAQSRSDGVQQPRRPPRKRNRKPKASTSSTPVALVDDAPADEPEVHGPDLDPPVHAGTQETLDEPPTGDQQLLESLQYEDQQVQLLQPEAQQPDLDILPDQDPQEMFIPDHPPPPQVPLFSEQLGYLRTTLDNVTAYLATLPAADPEAQEEVRLALGSADALAAQLRRLAQ